MHTYNLLFNLAEKFIMKNQKDKLIKVEKLNINEAIATVFINHGIVIKKKELAAKIWKRSTPHTQAVNFSKLVNGETQMVRISWIKIIAKECKVDFNFLLK